MRAVGRVSYGAQVSHSTPSSELRDGWRHMPHPTRLSAGHARFEEILERHDASVAARLPTYADPVSGFSVFTADFLASRAYCCESGCRHCPYVQ